MLFNSFEYLIFLPAVFLLYWFLFKGLRSRNLFLIAASYLFYGWWDYRFLSIIILISLSGYLSGRMLEAAQTKLKRKLILTGNLLISLGVLVTFKYFDFFADSFARVMHLFGMYPDSVTLDLILPVGISFYTFQSLSYTIDVYRKNLKACRDMAVFFVYISFFPQLVAGPIERATNMIGQFERNRRFDYGEALSGMKLILWGLFKKMVVADNAAETVNSVFGDFASSSPANLWIGAFLFSIQIYCDFSGYSDIAIGTARLFSIRLMTNFDKPYFSKSIKEFWKKWHISLTSWFRDYLYFPLGGSRKGKLKTIRNTFIIFLTSGLWHGANYTFIFWGAYHAVLFVPSLIRGNRKPAEGEGHRQRWFTGLFMMAVTFLLVMIGWIFFRADHIQDAVAYIGRMFSFTLPAQPIVGKTALAWSLLMLALEWLNREKETPFSFSGTGIWRSQAVRWSVYIITFIVILVFSGGQEDFIYFRF